MEITNFIMQNTLQEGILVSQFLAFVGQAAPYLHQSDLMSAMMDGGVRLLANFQLQINDLTDRLPYITGSQTE
jgi:hypothetical protein